jgi:hypothetical protein
MCVQFFVLIGDLSENHGMWFSDDEIIFASLKGKQIGQWT